MSVTCRRELMEIDAKLTEQLRNCAGISEIFDRWTNSTVEMAATLAATLACRAGMSKVEHQMLLCQ
jgi:hypothetical protein